LAEALQRHTGVSRQPVARDPVFGFFFGLLVADGEIVQISLFEWRAVF
jgi:hypothetical protein